MDEEKSGLMEALHRRISLTESQSRDLDLGLSSRELNLLLFVIQTFYIVNPSGMYKGEFIEPAREGVVLYQKVTFEGCKRIMKSLRISLKV